MGTKFSKAVRPHGQAVALPVATAHIHTKSHEANAQSRQDPPPEIYSRDDIDVQHSPASPTLLRRHDSAPSQSTSTATINMESDRATAFSRFLAERQHMDIDHAPAQGTVPPAITLPPPPPAITTLVPCAQETSDPECLVCCAQLPPVHDPKHDTEAIYPCNCDSPYCTPCIRDMFINACKDLTRMPPKCCITIHLYHAKPYLSQEEITIFKSKYEEWSTKNPFYCPVSTCSAFIPERLLPKKEKAKATAKGKRVDSCIGTPAANTFTCPTCVAQLCADCRQLAHPDSLCNVTEFGLDEQTAALLKAWGYKKCPKCGHGLKRMFGCNHMECRCGAHFCWVCLESKDSCGGDCREDEEEGDPDEDSEPDEPEDLDVPIQSEARPVTTDVILMQHRADELQHEDATPTTASNIVEYVTIPNPTTVLPVARPRNLDGGSHGYWEEQDLDFGEEPDINNQDRAWHCSHDFYAHKIPLVEALSTKALGTKMDCVKCWRTIYPDIDIPAAQTSNVKTVPAGARSRLQGIVRTTIRGGRRWVPPRGLFRANTTIGTAPHLTANLPTLSHNVPLREASPMEDIQFSDRIVDTYDNIITLKELDVPRRSSVHVLPAHHTAKGTSAASDSSILSTMKDTFSYAHECRFCSLLVCASCRDAVLATQQEDREANEAATTAEHDPDDTRSASTTDNNGDGDSDGDVDSDSDTDSFSPSSLHD